MDIIPTGTKVIIKQDDVPEQINTIFVPENSKEMESWEGEIIAIGPDVFIVKPGDKVLFGRYAGYNFEREREKYIFLEEEDILGIIKHSEAVHGGN